MLVSILEKKFLSRGFLKNLSLDNNGEHNQVFIAGVDQAVAGAAVTDMADTGFKNLFVTIAYGLSMAGNNIVQFIISIVTMQSDRSSGMDPAGNDPSVSVCIHFC